MTASGERTDYSAGGKDSGGKLGQDPKRRSISTLRRILTQRNQSIDGLNKKALLTKVQLGDERAQAETTKNAFNVALQEWSSDSMKEWLRQNSNKMSGTKKERMDRILCNISIEEAAAIAKEYRDRTHEMLNLPGEGDTAMDTSDGSVRQKKIDNEMDTDDGEDSEESEKTDATSPHKKEESE